MEVEISNGIVKLRKPLAGQRNKALMKAETPTGIKGTVFLVELMPSMIEEHPFGAQPLAEALDRLSIEDYDKLIDGASELLKLPVGDVEKKLEQPSSQTSTQLKDGSEKNSSNITSQKSSK